MPFGPNTPRESNANPASLQQLFAIFDRGLMSADAFKKGVLELGYTHTDSFNRIMAGYGASCSLSFTQVVKALKTGIDSRQSKEEQENIPTFSFFDSRTSTPRDSADKSAQHQKRVTIQRGVFDFLKGALSTDQMKIVFVENGVLMTPELERVLRRHDSDQSKTFQGLVGILEKYGVTLMRASHESGAMRGLLSNRNDGDYYQAPIKRTGNHGNFITWQSDV